MKRGAIVKQALNREKEARDTYGGIEETPSNILSAFSNRLPWGRHHNSARLTPARVHRGVWALLGQLGTPAKPSKPCGCSPGRPKGRLPGRAKRCPALKRAA
jgi:hypothetical protein